MNTPSKVSVIVPVYNMQAYLARCVDSLLAQTHPDIEVILVDDGSADESPAICDAYAVKDARVKAFHKPNSGVADATNMGLDNATGDFFLFVDSDDYIAPDMVERLLTAQIASGADTVQSGMSRVNEKNEVTLATESAEATFTGADEILREFFMGDRILLCLASKLFARRLFDTYRFESGRNIIDILATPFLLQQCAVYHVIPGAPYYAFFRSDSVSRGRLTDKTYGDLLYYLKKWKEFLQTYYSGNPEFSARLQYRACYEMSTRYRALGKGSPATDKKAKRREMRRVFRENYKGLKASGFYGDYPKKRRVMFRLFAVCPLLMQWASDLHTLIARRK